MGLFPYIIYVIYLVDKINKYEIIMVRGITLFLAMALVPLLGYSQGITTSQDSLREKVRDIKLSEKYVYAEATTPVGMSEAQQYSLDLLHVHVIGIFSQRFKMDPKDVEEIWDVIEDKCQNVVIKNGDLFRVCTYILKDAFAFHKNPGKALEKWKKAEAERAQQDSLRQSSVEPESELTADDTRKVEGIVSLLNKVGVETEDGSTVEEPAQVMADTVPTLYSSAPTTVVMTTPEAPTKVVTPAPVALVATGKATNAEPPIEVEELPSALESLPAPDRLLVTDLLALNSFDEVISFLEKGQREGKLIYGNVKTIKNPQVSYLVIIKDKRLVTVLNKGAKERMNLKTNTSDALKNYKGHGVIWFQVF